VGPDFSNVDIKRAKTLAQEGALVPLLLLPAEFGGKTVPQNVVYTPSFVLEQKRRIDLGIIADLVRAGKASRYEAVPEYQGTSVVPTVLRIRAYDPGDFNSQILIWGDALERDQRKK